MNNLNVINAQLMNVMILLICFHITNVAINHAINHPPVITIDIVFFFYVYHSQMGGLLL